MRFVDLNNGALYNGNYPYIHWFDDEQSTNLVYIKKLCVLCDDEYVNIRIDSNIFTLLNMDLLPSSNDENINGFTYKDISQFKTNNINSKGLEYDKYYLHMIYILAQSKNEGEFLEDLYINNEKFAIGSSFYDKYEPNKINLSNLGVDIPESFARAIYSTNIHEDEIDNIVVNRKYKELLNEYWNIIANKGSYKSLYNALYWFEYGDLIKIQEIWKNSDKYNQQDIKSYIDSSVKDYLSTNKKTTYIGLYLPLQKIREEDGEVIYPDFIDKKDYKDYEGFIREENPELVNISTKLSNDDLCMKMYLVGNFFETYFMPIHLDLIHSTVENIVFTNTIKLINHNIFNKNNYFNNIFTFDCNIDNDIFYLEDVNVQVGPDTVTGVQWKESEEYNDVNIIGVDKVVNKLNNESDLKTFMSQYYNGIGRIVDFICKVPLETNDFITKLNISILHDGKSLGDTFKMLKNKTESQNIKFSILCKTEGDYKVNIEFITANGYNYVKTVNFSILDNVNKNIKLYKVKYNTIEEHTHIDKYEPVYNYMYSHYTDNNEQQLLYIPKIKYNDVKNIHGVFMHRTIIISGTANINYIMINPTVSNNTKVLHKYKYNCIKKYICEDEQFILNKFGYNDINDPNIDEDTLDIIKRKLYDYWLYEGEKFIWEEESYYKLIGYSGDDKTNGFYALVKDINNFNVGSKPDFIGILNKEPEEYENVKCVKKVELSYDKTDKITHTIYILPATTPDDFSLKRINKERIIRDDYVFYPEKHHLEEINTNTLDDYTFTQEDVLMIVPNSKYLKYIEDPEWEFENISKKNNTKTIKFNSIKTPFIANSEYKLLDPGFYNIKFRYKLGKTIQEISLNSAFRIV